MCSFSDKPTILFVLYPITSFCIPITHPVYPITSHKSVVNTKFLHTSKIIMTVIKHLKFILIFSWWYIIYPPSKKAHLSCALQPQDHIGSYCRCYIYIYITHVYVYVHRYVHRSIYIVVYIPILGLTPLVKTFQRWFYVRCPYWHSEVRFSAWRRELVHRCQMWALGSAACGG